MCKQGVNYHEETERLQKELSIAKADLEFAMKYPMQVCKLCKKRDDDICRSGGSNCRPEWRGVVWNE